MFDSDSLFTSSQVSNASAGGKSKGKPIEKRDKLKRGDHLAAQILDPFGTSPIEKVTLKKIWETTEKGNDYTKYFSELAEKSDDTREGIGISRLAEILLLAIERLNSENMRKFAKEEILKDALNEAAVLEPHLRKLNGDKKKKQKRSLNALMVDQATAPTEEEVEQSMEVVYDWLKKPSTPLRGMLAFTAQEGVLYSAYCAARVAEGWVKVKPTSLEHAKAAAKARLCGEGVLDTSVPEATDSAVLFR